MVVHGHILVNGKKIDIPSYQIEIGDQISLRDKYRKNDLFRKKFLDRHLSPISYLERDYDNFESKLISEIKIDEVPIEINDQLVIEFYSRK